jgi:hypothetical protein
VAVSVVVVLLVVEAASAVVPQAAATGITAARRTAARRTAETATVGAPGAAAVRPQSRTLRAVGRAGGICWRSAAWTRGARRRRATVASLTRW